MRHLCLAERHSLRRLQTVTERFAAVWAQVDCASGLGEAWGSLDYLQTNRKTVCSFQEVLYELA